MEVENKYFTLKQYVDGFPSESDFELRSGPLLLAPQEGSKKVIVKNLFVSVDPYQINRMKKRSPSHKSANFAQRIVLGKRIDAMGVGRVVAACGYAEEELMEGDVVVGLLGWEDYTVAGPGSMLTKIPTSQFPLSYHVSVLGSSGLTAYAGFYQICKPRRGETVFVSAASGSVGHLVGQFAKLSGCYVVGCAGSKKKVDLLKGELGFDDAFNYKEERDINSALKRCFPSGIDIYFDNVGGEMLEAAVANMNAFGRVAVCGAISEYTSSERRAAPDMLDVIYKRITVQGFLAYDHIAVHDEFISVTSDYLRHGRMQSIEDISHGLKSIPSAFIALFRGDNVGKKLVQL
ncbi:NADP-dependent alkenal double bond reductase P1 [Ananas comosus]|uniref:NADP-dependent alkenal double bond reductase P1 n=1 Tax=Ananas comosus TaxID=4615 RepID=A0A199V4W3_ANACO|nr:NADP-dependent alkenal double bond reductase P1 [Ananas comosus]